MTPKQKIIGASIILQSAALAWLYNYGLFISSDVPLPEEGDNGTFWARLFNTNSDCERLNYSGLTTNCEVAYSRAGMFIFMLTILLAVTLAASIIYCGVTWFKKRR